MTRSDHPVTTGEAGIELLAVAKHKRGPLGGFPKRALDVSIAAVALTVAAPLMLLIFVCLSLSVGSPFYSHERVGFGGRRFKCHKFRSMVVDSEARLAAHLAEDAELRKAWATYRKLPDDPRITRIGRFLRKTSLDELPQLVNVLMGDMSCVGPRPVTAEELPEYGAYVGKYQSARPGLSGLWQISGRSQTAYSERVELDVAYVNDWSLRSDLAILARTPPALLRFRLAH